MTEEDITPKIIDQEVEILLEKFYGLRGGRVKKMKGYDDLNYYCLPKSSDNLFIETLWPYGYVLKIMNSLDSQLNDLCEAQNCMMIFLRENEIPAPLPVRNLYGDYYVKEKFPLGTTDRVQKEHIVRLLEFQPGTELLQVPKSLSLFYHTGMFLAQLNEVLKRFHHPVYKTHHSIWHLHSVPKIKSAISFVKAPQQKKLVEEIVAQFSQRVLSREETFEKGMIHGDFNEHNVLMTKTGNGEWKVSAVLDFGDSHQSNYLFELAISSCYVMLECKRHNINPITGAGFFIAGYLAVRPKFVIDYGLLKLCICARMCQSLVLGLKTFILHPENGYVLDSQSIGWPLLKELWDISEQKVTEEWESRVKVLIKTEVEA